MVFEGDDVTADATLDESSVPGSDVSGRAQVGLLEVFFEHPNIVVKVAAHNSNAILYFNKFIWLKLSLIGLFMPSKMVWVPRCRNSSYREVSQIFSQSENKIMLGSDLETYLGEQLKPRVASSFPRDSSAGKR